MTLKVACLGAGYFSQFHHDGWRRLDGADLVGVADHDVEKAKSSGAPGFGSLEEMLDSTKPDLLDIIVPPSAHADAITTALDFGLKTIICQKPFCEQFTTARDMVDLAKTRQATLIVHENFRFQPWFREIKRVIDAGEIGKPLQATWRLRPGDGQGPDAYLARQAYFQTMPRFMVHETGVHYIDVFRYIFGDPSMVYADLRKVNPVIAGEDAGLVTFDHDGGVRTLLDANRNLDHNAANTRCTMGEGLFEGTEGTLTVTGDGAVQLRRFGCQISTEILPPNQASAFGGDCTYFLQAHVLGWLLGKVPLENSAEDYLNVMRIEEAIYTSAEAGRKVQLDEHK